MMSSRINQKQSMEVQVVGLDVGRGFTNGYSEYKGQIYTCMFNSCICSGRMLDLSLYDNPIAIEFNGEKYFVGNLAIQEGGNSLIGNNVDSKVSETVEILIASALSQIAISDYVALMLTLPNKTFTKKTLDEVEKYYKDKVLSIRSLIDGTQRDIHIVEVSICREAEASLITVLDENPGLEQEDIGYFSIGYQSTELCRYSNGRFNDRGSATIDAGMFDVLLSVSDDLLEEYGITPSHREIDISGKYDNLKRKYYKLLHQKVQNEIGARWRGNIKIFSGGGTVMKLNEELKDFTFEVVSEPEMRCCKGAFIIMKELIG